VVLYLIPKTSIFGAILLTGYVGGTIITHLRLGEPVYTHIALGVLAWLGLYLRRLGSAKSSGQPEPRGALVAQGAVAPSAFITSAQKRGL